MDSILQDLIVGFRSLRATPRLTFAAVASIALGLGSAVFMVTLINAVLLRNAPFPQADRLVRVWLVEDQTGATGDLSNPEVRDIREASASFAAFEMAARTRFAVTTADGTERLRGESVSPGYFRLTALRPVLGRLFTPEEYTPGAHRVMVIGYDLWQRVFNGRADILGTAVRARSSEGGHDDGLYTIVGVLPAGFNGTVDADVSEFWLPVGAYEPRAALEDRSARFTWSIGLLRPGVSLSAAELEIEQVSRRLSRAYPKDYHGTHLAVEPFGESWRSKYRTGLLMLLGAAVLLLFIACTNVANLLLARLAHRETELVVRQVLGARPSRLLCQLLTESLLLAAAGGALGALLALAGGRLFARANVIKLPLYVSLAPDGRVLAGSLALVVLTGVVFGVLPAWFGSRSSGEPLFRSAGRGMTAGRRQRRSSQFLVVLEVSLTFVLLVASALMLRSYSNLLHGDVGFRTHHLLRMAVSLDPLQYSTAPSQLNFLREARSRLSSYPGVERVSFIAGVLPPWFDGYTDLAVHGEPLDALVHLDTHAVDAEFFPTLEIPVLRGRGLIGGDHATTPRVAVVSQSLARVLAGGDGSGAVGMAIQGVINRGAGTLAPPRRIVGIVGDVRYQGPLGSRRNDYDLYLPIEQSLQTVVSIAFATTVEPGTLIEPLRRELGRLAPSSPLHWISTMEGELGQQFGDNRFYAFLTAMYATAAALLALLGIYSLLAHSVSRRFGEIGIRMAVGAQEGDILRLVLRQGMSTLGLGVLVGSLLALLGTRILASLLHGVGANDASSFVAVAALMLGLGLLACYVPARRATRTDPLVVLRGE